MLTENIALNVFITTTACFLVAGGLKTLIAYFRKEKVNFHMAFTTGGMPSSHTAIISGLTTSIFMHEGFSMLFVTAFFVSMIVMSDAMGVRMETGRQAKALNKTLKTKEFNEKSGHTPLEVLGGLLLGISLGVLLFFTSI